jgi:hypothetical protein
MTIKQKIALADETSKIYGYKIHYRVGPYEAAKALCVNGLPGNAFLHTVQIDAVTCSACIQELYKKELLVDCENCAALSANVASLLQEIVMLKMELSNIRRTG